LFALGMIALLVAALTYGRPPNGRESAGETVSAAALTAAAPGGTAAHPLPMPGRGEVPAGASPAGVGPAASAGGRGGGAEARRGPWSGKSEDEPIPQGVAVGFGQGLLDIETGDKASIFVDGVEQGRGPFLRIALAPGTHDVRLRGLPDSTGTAEVRGSG